VARETFNIQKVVARIYDPRRAEVYERLGIPTIATVPWTAQRLQKTLLGEATSEAWRDPSGAVSMLHVIPNEGWVGHQVATFANESGAVVAMITRFGIGELATPATVIQSGDTLNVMTTDAQAEQVRTVASNVPQGAHA
jgi:trk system potassium uptake protein